MTIQELGKIAKDLLAGKLEKCPQCGAKIEEPQKIYYSFKCDMCNFDIDLDPVNK